VVGAAGLGLLALGLILRWPMTIPWSVLLVGGGYLLAREGNSIVDGWAAAVGVLLLLAAELASWSIEHDARIEAETSLVLRRLATLTGLIAAALLVNFMLLAAAGVSASSGILLAAVGVTAAVASVAVVLRLLRA
jgi:archaellum biogenesis protein FlaJ (TadC family)